MVFQRTKRNDDSTKIFFFHTIQSDSNLLRPLFKNMKNKRIFGMYSAKQLLSVSKPFQRDRERSRRVSLLYVSCLPAIGREESEKWIKTSNGDKGFLL